MTDILWEQQKAIYVALSGDATLGAMVTGVYDHVPENTSFPYVSIGEDTHVDWSTKTENGVESTITLHAWSRNRGRKECKQILGRIKTLLHKANLVVTGGDMVTLSFDFSDTFLDPDGLTYHGVMRFRSLISET